MKKKLLLILSLFIINISVFAKGFRGILNINLKRSQSEICDILTKDNWEIDYRSADKCIFKKDFAMYSFFQIDEIDVRFKNDKCCFIHISFKGDSTDNYEDYCDKFTKAVNNIVTFNELTFVDDRVIEDDKFTLIKLYIDKYDSYIFTPIIKSDQDTIKWEFVFMLP